jgi:putative inorganic carbon (HCO3(-)) transporter
MAGAVLLAAAVRPPVARRGGRVLDIALCAALIVVAAQLVPLPPRLRLALSPSSARMDSGLRLDAAGDPLSAPARALTVDAEATSQALAFGAALALLFWSARALFARGGVRQTIRAVSWCGLVASAMAILQHATAPKLLYWVWRPVNPNARPFGPFVNRNDLATWLVMALPLTLGYVVAHFDASRHEGHALDIERVVDERVIWLGASVCAMAAALIVSLSRSGLIATVAALVSLVWFSRGRLHGRGRAWLLGGIGLVALAAAAYANVAALMTRVGETLEAGVGGRREIWSDTIAMVRDFWPTGVGVGAYQRAMVFYQGPHVFSFNHAHNEYLQILAEGGVLLALPAAVAIVAGALEIAGRLRRDRTPVFWLRAGAASGLAAIAVQNVWETGLRMPANAVLFVVCAAIAVHQPHRP